MIGTEQKVIIEKTEKKVTFEVDDDGTIRTIYSDDLSAFAEKIGGEISTVCRASNVEWEVIEKPINARFPQTKGWSVRAVHDPELALRIRSSPAMGSYTDTLVCSREPYLAIALFDSRENAIKEEVKFFFELLPPNRKTE